MFNVNPIVKIREGCQNGSTIEYGDLGRFNVTTIQNYGYGTQKINLAAQREFDMMGFDRRIFSKELKKPYYYYNDFSNPDTLKDFSFANTVYWGISDGRLIRGPSIPNALEHAVVNSSMGLEDFIATVRIKGSHLRTDASGVGIYFKAQNINEYANPDGECVWLITPGGPLYQQYDNNSTTSLGNIWGASIGLADNTYYDIRLVVRGQNIVMQYRIPPNDYTTAFNFKNGYYTSGGVGICTYIATRGTVSVDSIEIREIGGHYTREEALEECVAQKDLFIDISNRLAGMSTFVAEGGVSYFLGTTNNYQQLDIRTPGSGGNSWNVLLTSGATFNDFCVEVETTGQSGNWMGLAVGNSGAWCGLLGNNGVVDWATELYSTGRSTFNFVGNRFIAYVPDVWSKLKLVKNEGYITTYLNGEYVNGQRVDFLLNAARDVKIGLFSYKGGASGSRVSFRNFRISELDDTMKTTIFDTQGNLQQDFNRMAPDGYVARQSGQTIRFYDIATLTGQTLANLENSTSSENLSAIKKYLYVKGDNMGAPRSNDDFRARIDAFNGNFDMVNDINLDDITTLNWTADSMMDILKSSDNQFLVKSMPYFLVDKYDTINFVDNTLGISRDLIVSSIVRHFEANGSMTQDLTLVDK